MNLIKITFFSAMKEARMHLVIGDVISLEEELTSEQKFAFVHDTLSPLMYQVTIYP